jgi:uncharacterized protein YaiL (DUF2058 family)
MPRTWNMAKRDEIERVNNQLARNMSRNLKPARPTMSHQRRIYTRRKQESHPQPGRKMATKSRIPRRVEFQAPRKRTRREAEYLLGSDIEEARKTKRKQKRRWERKDLTAKLLQMVKDRIIKPCLKAVDVTFSYNLLLGGSTDTKACISSRASSK